MLRDTMSAFETLLAADGVSRESLACVRSVVENDGMVTTGQAIRAVRLNGRTIRKLCAENGIRRVSRPGRQGSLVHLASLLRVAGSGRKMEDGERMTEGGARPDMLAVDDAQRQVGPSTGSRRGGEA